MSRRVSWKDPKTGFAYVGEVDWERNGVTMIVLDGAISTLDGLVTDRMMVSTDEVEDAQQQ